MKEKDIQKKITNQIKKAGGFVHKISDMSMGYKPFDFVCVYKGNVDFCELKVMKGTSLRFDAFRENQIAALSKIKEQEENNIYINPLLLIAVVENNKLISVKQLSIERFLWLQENSKRKSIPKEEIMKFWEYKFSPVALF
jgi:penicillin-binding protein-related factor A (putative recombinase)